jgi:hypothetical protein
MRPDIQVMLAEKTYLVDVNVTHVFAASNIARAQGDLLKDVEQINKYREMARAEDAVFVPFVMTTLGDNVY